MKTKEEAPVWWKERVGYQIYPKSFKGQDGSTGTVKGIEEKLGYLTDLGVDLLWICPIFDSPMDDNGYDVRSYFSLAKEFGTIEDLKRLLEKAHARGMKVIFDLILNHTSDEHEWFKRSEAGDPEYRDFYIWSKEKLNWGSIFGGNAFHYSKKRGEYYLSIFSQKMPDLNWNEPKVFEKMKETIGFLLDLGADGFRLDAVSHLGKAPLKAIGDGKETVLDFSKFSNLPSVHEVLHKFYEEVFSKHDLVTVGEIGGDHTVEEALAYTKEELSMVFTFDHVWCNNLWQITDLSERTIDIRRLDRVINSYQQAIKNGGWIGLYWLNHDHPRLMSAYGDENNPVYSGSMLACLMYFLKGTPFLYNGEEIGMTNYPFEKLSDFEDVRIRGEYADVKGKMSETEFVSKKRLTSRDNARCIMQWDDSEYAGFSTAKPWFHVNGNYRTVNVKNQLQGKSLLNEYRKIIALRKQYKEIFVYGGYRSNYVGEEFISYYRENFLVVCNLTGKTVPLPKIVVKRTVYDNYEREVCDRALPYEAFVAEV